MAYPTVSDVKTYIGTASNTEDTLLEWLLAGAIAFVEKWTERNFVAASDQTIRVVPEYPNLLGRDRRKLLIRDYDLAAVTSITNGDGEVLAEADYLLRPPDGPPYYCIEIYKWAGKCWTRGTVGYVEIEASSLGYSATCPEDVFAAILALVAHLYRSRTSGASGPVSTATRQGLMIPPSTVPVDILQMLQPYRRYKG